MMKATFYGALSLVVLSAACEKNETDPTRPERAVCKFVSVEYGEIEIVPIREGVDEKVVRNDSDRNVPATYAYRAENGFSSAFTTDHSCGSEFDECRVPIPQVDAEGVLFERFSTEAPFLSNATYTFVRTVTNLERNSELPARMQLKTTVTRLAYRLEAPFVCRMHSSVEGSVEIRGAWSGVWTAELEVESVCSPIE